jgi:hypothetical protein
MSIDRLQVKAGDVVEVQAFARTNAGKVFRPADSRDNTGRHADGNVLYNCCRWKGNTAGLGHAAIRPRDLNELVTTINKLRYSDRLYLQTFRTTNGAIIGSNEMPNLPPSVLATLNNDRTAGGIKPAVQTIVNEVVLAPAEFLITGQQTLTIEVVK